MEIQFILYEMAMFCTCLDAEECMDVKYLVENMKPLLRLFRMYEPNLLVITVTPGHLCSYVTCFMSNEISRHLLRCFRRYWSSL